VTALVIVSIGVCFVGLVAFLVKALQVWMEHDCYDDESSMRWEERGEIDAFEIGLTAFFLCACLLWVHTEWGKQDAKNRCPKPVATKAAR